jgi:hypothetical protein
MKKHKEWYLAREAERLWSTILHELISLLYAKEKKKKKKGSIYSLAPMACLLLKHL